MFTGCRRCRREGTYSSVLYPTFLCLTAPQSPGLEQYAMRAFADALDAVPMALAENSGLSPIETLANIKSRQAKENNSRLGVDCMQTGSNGTYLVLLLPLSILRAHGTYSCTFRFATSNTNSTIRLLASLFVVFSVIAVVSCFHLSHASTRDALGSAVGVPPTTPARDVISFTPTHYLRIAFVMLFTRLEHKRIHNAPRSCGCETRKPDCANVCSLLQI